MDLQIYHLGKALTPAPTQTATTTIGDLREQISKTLQVSPTCVRLLSSGRTLTDDAATPASLGLARRSKLLVLSTDAGTIATLRAKKPDALVRPFSAPAPRYTSVPRRTATRRPEGYGFGRVEELAGLPNAARARAILDELATDAGFLGAMKRRGWRVGALKEMKPDGRVGVDPVCVMGYNTNKGAEIHLRLRTDDMQGFRDMKSIRHVLAHELAHNEISEHDDRFKELMRQIEREAAASDWMRTGGRAVGDVGYAAGGRAPVGVDPLDERRDDGRMGAPVAARLGGGGGGAGGRVTSRLIEQFERENKAAKSTAESVAESTAKSTADGASGAEEEQREEGVEKASAVEKVSAVTELVAMGFDERLAGLALRENRGDVARGAEWLVSQAEDGDGDDDTMDESWMSEHQARSMRAFTAALGELLGSTERKQAIETLDTIHIYLSNLVRQPSSERFSRINSANGAFERRVGAVRGATNALHAVGFRLIDGHWTFQSLDMAVVWTAKRVLQRRLVGMLV